MSRIRLDIRGRRGPTFPIYYRVSRRSEFACNPSSHIAERFDRYYGKCSKPAWPAEQYTSGKAGTGKSQGILVISGSGNDENNVQQVLIVKLLGTCHCVVGPANTGRPCVRRKEYTYQRYRYKSLFRQNSLRLVTVCHGYF